MLTLTLLTLRAAAPIAVRKERVVGIVGSGVAGAATAHFLRESRPDLRVIVFERDALIGGRARTVDLGGRRVDLRSHSNLDAESVPPQLYGRHEARERWGPSTLAIYDGAAFASRAARVRCPWLRTSRSAMAPTG